MPASSPPVARFLEGLGLPAEGDLAPYARALTHRSAVAERGGGEDYERLEFLGDAVLKLAVSELLFARYPHMDEGALTKVRAWVVSDRVLAGAANRLDWGRYLVLGPSERATRGTTKVGTLASSLEAFLGAHYLVHGLPAVAELVARWLSPEIDAAARDPGAENAKALLQELTQGRGQGLPAYRQVGEEGAPGERVFVMEVLVAGEVLGQGRGTSKKQAEQLAAGQALVKLKGDAR